MNETTLLGSTFETSLRILILLNELNMFLLDEQQITAIDFIAIYGSDFGILDENLHGYGIYRFSEFSAKSKAISKALKKLVVSSQIDFISDCTGYSYRINDNGKEIVNLIQDMYSNEYKIAVNAVLNAFPSLDRNVLLQKIYETAIKSL